jgi:hypothetical protein
MPENSGGSAYSLGLAVDGLLTIKDRKSGTMTCDEGPLAFGTAAFHCRFLL